MEATRRPWLWCGVHWLSAQALEECLLVRPQMQQERRPHADPGCGAACTGSRRWCLVTGLGMSSPLVNPQEAMC